jgi:hypothetical protein
MDLAQLRAADPARVFRAAERIARIRDGLKDAADRVNATVRQPIADGAWSGTASTAALGHIDKVGKELADATGVVGQAGQESRRFADTLADAKALVARADDIAGAARFTIGKDGSITFPTFDTPLTEAEAQSLKAAGEEAHGLLSKALTITAQADAACASALAHPRGLGETVGAAMGSILAPAEGSPYGDGGGGGNGDSLGDRLGALFDDPDVDFDESLLGDILDGDVWTDPDGFHLGDMSPMEEVAFDEVFGGSPDELLGEEVVDTVEEEGVWAGVEEWWDQSWEDTANIPDRMGEAWDDVTGGLEDFADDPVGTIGGLFD